MIKLMGTIKQEQPLLPISVLLRNACKHGVLNNSGRWCDITGPRKDKAYRLAEPIGRLNKLGDFKIVFSRRKGNKKQIALVTDDLHAPMEKIVTNYLKRWAIEMLIMDEKQHLGLGDYRVLRYRAVARTSAWSIVPLPV